ncbi:MAG: class I SAM-dependent methyltransferase [Thermomicrobiales bacterium]
MDWAPAFYARQYEWLSDDAFWTVQAEHHERAAQAMQLAGPPPQRVLELGAGGGQTAAAMADLGFEVVANELLPAAVERARVLADMARPGSLTILPGDFFRIEPPGRFDLVTYWDGFGIGEDDDQRGLLARIAGWLGPGGRALIEVYTPCYWAEAAGRTMQIGAAERRYGFDADGCRMLDRWQPAGAPEEAVEQSLRCYSPADLRLLLKGTGLRLVRVTPGGHWDDDTRIYTPEAPLAVAMTYLATLDADC